MKTSTNPLSHGFSLVEILVVIFIIGIVASVAVPSISSFLGTAEDAKVARNAQNLASTYSAGLAAGHDFADGETQVADIVQNIVAGTTIMMSPGEHIFIGVPNLEESEQTKASASLEIIGERLVLKQVGLW